MPHGSGGLKDRASSVVSSKAVENTPATGVENQVAAW
jgi:hypothetical protein